MSAPIALLNTLSNIQTELEAVHRIVNTKIKMHGYERKAVDNLLSMAINATEEARTWLQDIEG